MNKVELVNKLSEISGLTKAGSEKALKAFEQAVTDELVAGGEVKLSGFISFDVVEKAEREGRNPQTNTPMTIPAKKAPRVKIGKSLKDAVKGE